MKFDLQDALLLAGVASVVGGVAMWSRPAALILFGILCFGAVLLIQAGSRKHERRIHAAEKRKAS